MTPDHYSIGTPKKRIPIALKVESFIHPTLFCSPLLKAHPHTIWFPIDSSCLCASCHGMCICIACFKCLSFRELSICPHHLPLLSLLHLFSDFSTSRSLTPAHTCFLSPSFITFRCIIVSHLALCLGVVPSCVARDTVSSNPLH